MDGPVKTLTVRELRELLARESLDPDMECIVRVRDDENDETLVGGLVSADVDPGCAEIDALLLDGDVAANSMFWCANCNSEIDPTMCHCGETTDAHNQGSGHSPVAMGCRCHEAT